MIASSTPNVQWSTKFSHHGSNRSGTVTHDHRRRSSGASHAMSPTSESRTWCTSPLSANTARCRWRASPLTARPAAHSAGKWVGWVWPPVAKNHT
ncbi:MAG: hypothetical protein ABMA64_28360, partial [Myxococcota bacterium]